MKEASKKQKDKYRIIYMRNLLKMLQMNLSINTQTESQIQKTNFCYQRGKGDQFSSVQFSRSVVSDSLRHHESQHARWGGVNWETEIDIYTLLHIK